MSAALVLAQTQSTKPGLTDACGDDPSWICQTTFEWIENRLFAKTVDFFVARPLKILLILVLAWVVNRLVRRAIRRFVIGVSEGSVRRGLEGLRQRAPGALQATGEVNLRAAQRAETIGSVLRSIATAVIWGIAVLMVLSELGLNLGPLIAGAGVVGIALGFGAQTIVKDFLSGMFMLIEDQYGVGDIIDVGDATGTVESITLRTTRLRDVNGTVWHVPNGSIARVGNKSQEWARALLDVSVGYGTDLDEATRVIKEVADGVWQDPKLGHSVLEEPEVWGIETLGVDGIAIRLVVKTRPADQFKVMRELRRQLKVAFDEAGIEMPFPQRTIWVRQEGAGGETNGEGASGIPGVTSAKQRAPAPNPAPASAPVAPPPAEDGG
jgi:small conductance mechanosensitive channel